METGVCREHYSVNNRLMSYAFTWGLQNNMTDYNLPSFEDSRKKASDCQLPIHKGLAQLEQANIL